MGVTLSERKRRRQPAPARLVVRRAPLCNHVGTRSGERRGLFRVDDVEPAAARLVAREPELEALAALGEILVAALLVLRLLAFFRFARPRRVARNAHVDEIVVARLA